MKNKLMKLVLSTLLVTSVIACGPGKRKSDKAQDFSGSKFELEYKSDKSAIKGGTINVAISQDTPFKGIFSPILYSNATDWDLLEHISPSIFWTDEDFNIVNGGISDFNIDIENKVVTLKFRQDVKWEDGKSVTVDDLIYAYEILAHPDYTGVRYDEDLMNVIGIEEYHAGKVATIKGLEKINDYEMKVHLKEITPNVLGGAGGLQTYIVPKHYLKDIPIAKLEQSEQVRIKPLSYGPYRMTQIIPGESVEYVPNEYWYEASSMPMVDKMVIKILPSSSLISSMKIGEFDIYKGVGSSTYKEYKDFDNFAILGKAGLNYAFIGFNGGHWDAKKGINIQDNNKTMADLELRKAMSYALNIEEVVERYYNNLKEKANSPVPPAFKKYHPTNGVYEHNIAKANEILDKAGYKDIDGDGIRENKEGKPLVIRLAMTGGSEISEALSQKFIQDWRDAGLNVTLATGRLMGSNFWQFVESNEGYEVFLGGFNTGSTIDLLGLFGETAQFNMTRFVDEKSTQLMKEVSSLEALKDNEYRIKKIAEWNEYYMENVLGAFPIWYTYELLPINKRVAEYSYSNATEPVSKIKPALTQIELLPSTK